MNYVSVLIMDKGIKDNGILSNAALVMGLTAGRRLPDHTFGYDVVDGDGFIHTYLTNIGHIVRKAGQRKMRSLRELFVKEPDIIVVDYTEDAATVHYSEYEHNLSKHSGEDIQYRGIYVYGPKEKIIPYTKNLSRLS